MAQFPLIDQASLVMIPGAYKEGKIYSQLPTDGSGDFTYTRGTDTATRVNENGLIEKERANLLLQSNSFDTTWSAVSGTITSGQSGYDGTNNAWLLSRTAAGGSVRQSVSLSNVQTTSVYAKAGSLNWMAFVGGGSNTAYFDLQNGSLGTVSGAVIEAKIESVGTDGWYRCSITQDVSLTEVRIYPALGNFDLSANGSIYIQDAQLEQGLVATDYIETTTVPVYAGLTDNMPRLDYSGGASCPALLLEPQRFNAIDSSEYGGAWSAINANITKTENATTSPEGVNNAVKLEGLTTSSANQIVNFGTTSLNGVNVVGKTYTASVYLKPVNAGDVGTDIVLSIQRTSGDYEGFNVTAEITSADWKRYDLTYTFTGEGAANQIGANFKILRDGGTSIDDIYIWGVQLEEGSFATSYIPTYGSAVTRIAESALRSTLNLSKSDFTLFVEFEFYGVEAGDEQRFYISRGVDNDSAILGIKNGTQIQMTRQSGGVTLFNDTLGAQFSAGNNYKYLGKWSSGDNKSFLNGVQKTSNTTTYADFTTDITHLNLTGSQPDGAMLDYGLKVKQVLYFPTALTDTECIALTTI